MPEHLDSNVIQAGMRVAVPFGNSKKKANRIGVIVELVTDSDFDVEKLKACAEVLDHEPVFNKKQLSLLKWASAYYHHSIGEVIFSAIPTLLRQGKPAVLPTTSAWQLTETAPTSDDSRLKRAIKQSQVIEKLRQAPNSTLQTESLKSLGSGWRNVVNNLVEKSWVVELTSEVSCETASKQPPAYRPKLNPHQASAVEDVSAKIKQFQPFLLDGVTGSGKTEVYFRIIENVIAEQQQALILIPEIGLTKQLIDRFKARFSCSMTVLHSGLSDKERMTAWLLAYQGKASIVIGTRSAIWTPLPNLGVIIVDEEHDGSYKQQDGFRYSARDIAIVRAQREKVPVILGSATPALETLNNVQQKKCHHLILPERAGEAQPPAINFIDIRSVHLNNGLSKALIEKIGDCIADNKQALLFLNRRGFSPVMMCHECGWIATCNHCDANLTFHQSARQMRCHHCGSQQRMQTHCPECDDSELIPIGQGTEQITEVLQQLFPEARILRIDRDSTSKKGEMDRMLAMIQNNEADILVGTQMLSKGHHFPNVTLVGILDADNRLYGADFRSTERLAQLIIQVAGRAGRAEHPGKVYIQTHHPEHPALHSLANYDFAGLAEKLMKERSESLLPPFSSMVIIRAEANQAGDAMNFLQAAKTKIQHSEQIEVWGPMAAQMERRAGRFRAQLVIQSTERQLLHRMLDQWVPQIESLKKPYTLRWSLDVDPQDTF